MGIFERIEDVIKSYLNDEDEAPFGKTQRRGDPDYQAAYEELNEYLNDGTNTRYRASFDHESRSQSSRTYGSNHSASIPEDLRQDFAELGLSFGASADECKAAYKKLLKIHHPDRHAGHAENMRKATAKSARINAAYDRIENWRQGKQ
ncbi:MAG: J domain-containing protein [Treponema sp.]|jgi:DnaJ-domain-containing protein 1|nr:J domain-containing protein [Treponema sp.]